MKVIFSLMLNIYIDYRIIPSRYLREMTTWLSLFLDKQEAVLNYSYVWWREGVFVMGLFLLLVVMTTSFYNRYLKSSSMGKVIKPIQKQYLFYTLLPASLYKVSRLSCLGIRMDHLLFNEQGIYLIQKLKGQGVLSGKVEDWCLKFLSPTSSIEKTIKNPIPVLESKISLLKELLKLYEINLMVEGYYVYDEQQLCLQLSPVSQKLNFIKEQELQCFFKQLSTKATSKTTLNDDQLQRIFSFVISMRYVEYLRGFYNELSLVDKVHLSSTLSRCSKELLAFFVSPNSLTIQKIQQFKHRYLEVPAQRIHQLQTKLFHELETWALTHPDLEFMSFNEEVLTFSEGFQLSHLDRKEPFVILHDS